MQCSLPPANHAASKELTSPDASVITVPGSIKTDGDGASIPILPFREYRSNMSAMMLNSVPGADWKLECVQRRNILGMAIVHDGEIGHTQVVHCHEVANRLLKRCKGLVLIQIADMLANECLASDNQSNRILEIGSHC